MGTRISADRDVCIGAGLCTVAAEHFDIDRAGKVVLLQTGDVQDSDLPLVEDAVSMCPAEALRLHAE
ncbi:ferredoxin [Pseudonocardia halophobica]|uniref:ferredoxin n=1 Tax=Pseudonocardia halophobica TaxID=29401 RepID=UPI003D8ABC0C